MPPDPLASSPFGRGIGLRPLNFCTQVYSLCTQVQSDLGKTLPSSVKYCQFQGEISSTGSASLDAYEVIRDHRLSCELKVILLSLSGVFRLGFREGGGGFFAGCLGDGSPTDAWKILKTRLI